jgi:hypothetical protein
MYSPPIAGLHFPLIFRQVHNNGAMDQDELARIEPLG